MNQNNKGFTLIEVTIALGLSTVVFFGVNSLFKSNSDSSKKLNVSLDKNIFYDEISRSISNRFTCAETLQNIQVGQKITAIKRRGKNLYSVGQVISKKAEIKSISVEKNPNWEPVADKYGPASLKIEIVENGKSSSKYLPISVQLDKNKLIIGCDQKLELSNVNEDVYNKLCTDVVGGGLSGKKCNWSKPVVTIVNYLPAPVDPSGSCSFSPVICQAYINIGREPDKIDPGGAQYWQDKLNSGISLAQVQADMHNTVAVADAIAANLGLADSQTLLNGSAGQQATYYSEIAPILNPR